MKKKLLKMKKSGYGCTDDIKKEKQNYLNKLRIKASEPIIPKPKLPKH